MFSVLFFPLQGFQEMSCIKHTLFLWSFRKFHTIPAQNAPLQVLCNLIKIDNTMKQIAVNEAKTFKTQLLAA